MFANACINLCAPSLFHCIKIMELHPQFAPQCKPSPATSNWPLLLQDQVMTRLWYLSWSKSCTVVHVTVHLKPLWYNLNCIVQLFINLNGLVNFILWLIRLWSVTFKNVVNTLPCKQGLFTLVIGWWRERECKLNNRLLKSLKFLVL